MKIKELNPRIYCADGVSLSVQGNQYAYCSPRIDDVPTWQAYTLVEVGYITDANEKSMAPPDTWREYGDGEFPSSVYGYVPTGMVEQFIEDHGGEVSLGDKQDERVTFVDRRNEDYEIKPDRAYPMTTSNEVKKS